MSNVTTSTAAGRLPTAPPILSASATGITEPASDPAMIALARCRGCQSPIGRHAFGVSGTREKQAHCALCWLVRHLERPRIDDEARLIWLPGMSQAALNATVRAIHLRQRVTSLGLRRDSDETRADRFAEAGLLACAEAVRVRLGSDRASDLCHALLRLPRDVYAQRGKLLSGVRLLSLGRFFDGESDIYPEILDGWREATRADQTG